MVEKKSKTWSARASWVDSSGKRRRKHKGGFLLKRDAEQWEQEYIRTHSELATDAEDIKLGEFLDKYLLAKKPAISYNTYAGYSVCINRIKRFCCDRKLRSLKRLDYELIFQTMAKDNVETKSGKSTKLISRNTLHYCYRVLRSALNYAVETDYIEKNPVLRMRLPTGETKFEYHILNADEGGRILIILKEYDYQLYLLVLLCLVYGLRRGEALGLRWQDIDWKNDCIHICGQYTIGENGNEYRNALKTSSSYRKLYLQPYVKDELYKAYKALHKTGRIKEYICELEGLPSPNAMTKRWRKFADNNGFEGVRLHDLRHSSAMIMVESGVDINTIKKHLGHSKISTTEIYLHNNFTASQKAAESVVLSLFEQPKKLEKFSGKNSDQFKTNLG